MFIDHRFVSPRDPDSVTIATFEHLAMQNPLKSKEAGRPIFDDVEVCKIRFAGSRDVKPFPASAFSHWGTDPQTGEQVKVSYAERFRRQYQQFKEQAQQTKTGTPLEGAQFLTEGKRAELRALNVYTVEQLAAVDGQELKNLGPGGRELKNQAEEFIAAGLRLVPNIKLEAELEALRARNQVLEADNEVLKTSRAGVAAEFDNMTDESLREFIAFHTGAPPTGNIPRKMLVSMAIEARPREEEALT